jgi:hypothetical protein
MNTNRAWLALGVLAAGAMLASCGGETAATPDAIPSTSPTPAPAATPTPVPNPGSVGAFACRLPASSNPRAFTDGCPEERGQLADYVNAAIDKAMRERPELFNFAEMNGPSPRVVDRDRYHRVVAENLVQSGVCTIIEKEELAIKQSNAFSEQWVIYTSSGFVRRRYQATCSPAWF